MGSLRLIFYVCTFEICCTFHDVQNPSSKPYRKLQIVFTVLTVERNRRALGLVALAYTHTMHMQNSEQTRHSDAIDGAENC